MNEEYTELSQAVLEAMEGAAQVRSALVGKIASLEQENEGLRRNAVGGDTVRKLVGALAEAGVVDRFNEAYFNKSASDGNTAAVLGKLLELLPQAAPKTAAAGPFQVDKGSTKVSGENDAYSRRLAELAKRA